jgi:hypothetical protein
MAYASSRARFFSTKIAGRSGGGAVVFRANAKTRAIFRAGKKNRRLGPSFHRFSTAPRAAWELRR